MKYSLLGATLLCAVTLSGCANSNCDASAPGCSDPLEGFNRTMFDFNYHVLDPYVVRPTAIFWRDYVPSPIRTSIINFTTNLSEPSSMVNYLLQGEPKQAAIHLTRFILNTVIGLGGLIDVASFADKELKAANEREFGSVLGHYDVGYGPYFVLPFYGSATLREDGGGVVDKLYPPLSLLTSGMSIGKWLIQGLDARARLLDYDQVLKNSDDPYSFTRGAYYQRKNFLANDGKTQTTETQSQKELADVLDEIDSADLD